MADFEVIKELGKGSYGTVFQVKSVHDCQTYVLKKINLKHMKVKHQCSSVREVQILRELKHPHVIKYFTSFLEKETLHIVMEFAQKGDLYKLVKDHKQRKKYLSEKDIWDFSYQILKGIHYLHCMNIMHRDIKCLNIFITEEKIIKIGDLGVSKIIQSGASMQGTRVGTPLYLAPEQIQHQPYDLKADMWAVGCAFYHLACLEPPFQGDNLISLGNQIVSRKPKPIPHVYSNKLRSFIEKFLCKAAADRPSAKQALDLVPVFVKNGYNVIVNSTSLNQMIKQNEVVKQCSTPGSPPLQKSDEILILDKKKEKPLPQTKPPPQKTVNKPVPVKVPLKLEKRASVCSTKEKQKGLAAKQSRCSSANQTKDTEVKMDKSPRALKSALRMVDKPQLDNKRSSETLAYSNIQKSSLAQDVPQKAKDPKRPSTKQQGTRDLALSKHSSIQQDKKTLDQSRVKSGRSTITPDQGEAAQRYSYEMREVLNKVSLKHKESVQKQKGGIWKQQFRVHKDEPCEIQYKMREHAVINCTPESLNKDSFKQVTRKPRLARRSQDKNAYSFEGQNQSAMNIHQFSSSKNNSMQMIEAQNINKSQGDLSAKPNQRVTKNSSLLTVEALKKVQSVEPINAKSLTVVKQNLFHDEDITKSKESHKPDLLVKINAQEIQRTVSAESLIEIRPDSNHSGGSQTGRFANISQNPLNIGSRDLQANPVRNLKNQFHSFGKKHSDIQVISPEQIQKIASQYCNMGPVQQKRPHTKSSGVARRRQIAPMTNSKAMLISSPHDLPAKVYESLDPEKLPSPMGTRSSRNRPSTAKSTPKHVIGSQTGFYRQGSILHQFLAPDSRNLQNTNSQHKMICHKPSVALLRKGQQKSPFDRKNSLEFNSKEITKGMMFEEINLPSEPDVLPAKTHGSIFGKEPSALDSATNKLKVGKHAASTIMKLKREVVKSSHITSQNNHSDFSEKELPFTEQVLSRKQNLLETRQRSNDYGDIGVVHVGDFDDATSLVSYDSFHKSMLAKKRQQTMRNHNIQKQDPTLIFNKVNILSQQFVISKKSSGVTSQDNRSPTRPGTRGSEVSNLNVSTRLNHVGKMRKSQDLQHEDTLGNFQMCSQSLLPAEDQKSLFGPRTFYRTSKTNLRQGDKPYSNNAVFPSPISVNSANRRRLQHINSRQNITAQTQQQLPKSQIRFQASKPKLIESKISTEDSPEKSPTKLKSVIEKYNESTTLNHGSAQQLYLNKMQSQLREKKTSVYNYQYNFQPIKQQSPTRNSKYSFSQETKEKVSSVMSTALQGTKATAGMSQNTQGTLAGQFTFQVQVGTTPTQNKSIGGEPEARPKSSARLLSKDKCRVQKKGNKLTVKDLRGQ